MSQKQKQRLNMDHFQSSEIFEDEWLNGIDRVQYALTQMKHREHCDILEADKLKKTAKAKP